MNRQKLTDKYICCDECNKEIEKSVLIKNVLVYHCAKESNVHDDGYDICLECAKKKIK